MMSGVKAFIISSLFAAIVIVVFGLVENDLTIASIGLAVLSFGLSVAAHRKSQIDAEKQHEQTDKALDALHDDVEAIKAHLAVPENVDEARQLADRVEAVEWKLDHLRYRPWWKFWRP